MKYIQLLLLEICTLTSACGYIVLGVKQGDPLSPLLFNLVMNPLTRDLQMNGFRLGSHEIRVSAFADYIVLLADSNEMGQDLVDHVRSCMNKLGLTLNPHSPHSSLHSQE
jgi:hypothetical protein